MNALAVVDASIVYKWLHSPGEDSVTQAVGLLQSHLEGAIALIAPSHMPGEVANALRWKPHLESDDVVELIGDLADIDISLFDVTYERLTSATELAYKHKLTVYDALFLALARELDCPFVTADHKAFAGIDAGVEIRLL